ncbi:MAG: diaminopimelate decarboxylase [Gammaproteobacteria bacterium]|jgi:diaminopimelate decarboxylase
MQGFQYSNGLLYAESVSLVDLEKRYGTPSYVYSRAAIESQWQSYDHAFGDRPHLICYAVKANGNLGILNILARMGSGFDIVSIGELHRVIKAGGEPSKIVFSGVGKRPDEIKAALVCGVKCLNIESRSELLLINTIAGEIGKKAPVSIRVNPDVDPITHPYISTGLKDNKFGIAYEDAQAIFIEANGLANIEIVGVDCHIGSQITKLEPYHDALNRILLLTQKLIAAEINIRHIDIGGGLGIRYEDEQPPLPSEFVTSICNMVKDETIEILIEPGRSIVGNAGLLLCRILNIKKLPNKNFAIVDAAMNDLIRPVLYDAWQDILSVREESEAQPDQYDIVGPICESGDILGLNRTLSINEGDLLAILGVGAYCFSMSSNYNARPRAVELLVDGQDSYEVRRRESIEDLYQGEEILP